MRQGNHILMLAWLFALLARAEGSTPAPDVFIGYSFMRVNSPQPIPAFNSHGGLAVVGFNFNNHLGMEFEFGGYHSSNIDNVGADRTSFSYAVGPRVSWGRSKMVDPYVHALFGLNHATSGLANVSVSRSSLAIPVGGGIDIKFGKHILFRPVQLDYYFTRVPVTEGLTTENKNQRNLRWATGVVLTFGTD